MLRSAMLAVFLATSIGVSAPPADSPFVFPSDPPAPTPPAPAPKPGTVPQLTGDLLYVINSKVDADVSGYPDGLIKVTKETGPIRVRGRFIDGTGATETKNFPGPFVFIVESSGKGVVDLVTTPIGLKTSSEIVKKKIEVDSGTAPQPPPKPVDPANPDPLKSLRVIIIYESGDSLNPNQRAVVYGKAVEDWLNANCTGGKAGWRRRDKDAPGEADATMKALWDAVKPAVTVTPCFAVERNGKVEIINIEATPAKMVEVLNTYKGK